MSFIFRRVTKRNVIFPKLEVYQTDISKVCRLLFLNNSESYRWYTPFGSNVSDNDPLVIEREKKRLLGGKVKGPMKHAPGWNERLASDSEAMVKAEREPDHQSIAELQQETLSHLLNLHGDEGDEIIVKKEVEVKHHDKRGEFTESAKVERHINK
ncbi:981_t:CDS:2 [Scutellospora calospora]|uniref:981_t:CDS:1 n=1 Tax=Scutellospora calospora TaxID=85575 RepID=A0ACA9JU34_9GLOM|nr:981_t:CDS:2 [Scutellospora calospora]